MYRNSTPTNAEVRRKDTEGQLPRAGSDMIEGRKLCVARTRRGKNLAPDGIDTTKSDRPLPDTRRECCNRSQAKDNVQAPEQIHERGPEDSGGQL
jgi:hypothetical protein